MKSGRRFIRGIPIAQARTTVSNPTWVVSLAPNNGRDPDNCRHGTVVRGIVDSGNDDLRRKFKVPPGDRLAVFLPNPEGDWLACSLCGSVRNPAKNWIGLYETRT